MIIEFNGLPATGKTTVAGEMKNILEKQGFRCVNKYQKKESRIARYISYVFDGSLILHFLAQKYARSIYGNDIGKNRKITSIMVYYYRMYREFDRECRGQILLVDQGLLQGLISIAHIKPVTDNKAIDRVMKFLSKKNIRFFIVNCKNDPQLSFERIRNRNTDFGRLDSFEDASLKEALKTQAANFDIVRASAERNSDNAQLEIDTLLSPYQNAVKIIKAFVEVDV